MQVDKVSYLKIKHHFSGDVGFKVPKLIDEKSLNINIEILRLKYIRSTFEGTTEKKFDAIDRKSVV